MNKLRSLEMIRAFAALLVILFHTQSLFEVSGEPLPLWGLFSAGYRGVDLFFVLSGFIIAYVHASDAGRASRLRNYSFNRLARIYPAVWVMSLIAAGLYASGFGGGKAGKLDPLAIIASFLLLPQQSPPLVNVTWTLTYEMFFYLLFAVVIVNARFGWCLLLSWQLSVAVFALSGAEPTLSEYYLRSICLDFGVGLACAWCIKELGITKRPGRWYGALWVGVSLFTIGMVVDKTLSWAGGLCAIGGAAILLSVVQLERAGKLLISNVLVEIGGASYAIYMVHFSVITICVRIFYRLGVPPSNALCLVCACLGIIIGMIFNWIIDKPIQRYLRLLKLQVL